ncbi:uncharacterized protein [Diadema setosum]|uniref:uncharacterized protein n=1 Tax=Diadema setosum TaxID=31175 RepID=UPI003B3BB3AC
MVTRGAKTAKKTHTHLVLDQQAPDPLEKLRTKIETYKPGSATGIQLTINMVNLGLFGASGKSAFINSVIFAVKGAYHKHEDESDDTSDMSGGSHTLRRIPYRLADQITLVDNRGLKDYSDDTTQYIDQMRVDIDVGKRIHCPIFVADARDDEATKATRRFLYEFSPEVEKLCGATVDTAEDLIVWYNGQKSGTRFDDGSVDILVSQNYSLVFKQPVDFNVAGQYICRVSNYKAELHANSTIVTVRDFQVQTAPRLTVWKGETTSLPCGLPYTPYRVQWVNESSGEVVASYTDGVFSYPSHKSGKFNMDNAFTLTIQNVNVLDETTLRCEAFAYDSRSWKNSTVLTVNAYGSGPSFDKCQGDKQCTKEVKSREIQLSCTVGGAKPNVTMSMTAAGSSNLTLLTASFKTYHEDGTSDQTVYANVSMSSESSSEIFTCSASGEAVQGIANATITVNMKSATSQTAAITVSIIVLIVAIVLALLYFLLFKRNGFRRLRENKVSLEDLRRKMNTYKPGDAAGIKLTIDKVNLELFGVMSHGKSAFVNSVIFALTGDYQKRSDEDDNEWVHEGVSWTVQRNAYPLSDRIKLFDNRGWKDFSLADSELTDQIKSKVESEERMHCAIFIADARSKVEIRFHA